MGLNDCLTSQNFHKILKVILSIGNYLNYKTNNGSARAFKLSTLRKLRDTRSTIDAKVTLLHFLVGIIEKEMPDALKFVDELSSVEAASKIPVTKIKSDISNLRSRMESITSQLEATPTPIEQKFFDQMKLFTTQCTDDLRSVESRFQLIEKGNEEFLKSWGEEPSVALDEVFGEILFFVCDFKNAQSEIERKRKIEEKRKAIEEKKRLESEKPVKNGDVGDSGVSNGAVSRVKIKKQQPPARNQFGREMGPLDLLFTSINQGNFNLKKVGNDVGNEKK
jgi:hypothetical protein